MSQSHLFSSDTRKSAYIRDDALILYFETAETPLVARFDLDSLVQANFEVTKKDESFALVLRDFSGQRQEITTFANKADAHQALYAILQALLSYGENKKNAASKPNLFLGFVKWLLIGFALATIVALALIWFATPVSMMPATTAPQQEREEPSASVQENVPQGEPMNLDQFIAPTLNASPSEEPQTGMTTPQEASPSEESSSEEETSQSSGN